MQQNAFTPIRNSDLPASFRLIRLELARSSEHPEGDDRIGYFMTAPLDEQDRIDAASWKSHRDACRVTRFRPTEEDVRGHLVHRPGGSWAFRYDVAGAASEESGFHFEEERFRQGEYVSLREAGATHTYRISSVTPL